MIHDALIFYAMAAAFTALGWFAHTMVSEYDELEDERSVEEFERRRRSLGPRSVPPANRETGN